MDSHLVAYKLLSVIVTTMSCDSSSIETFAKLGNEDLQKACCVLAGALSVIDQRIKMCVGDEKLTEVWSMQRYDVRRKLFGCIHVMDNRGIKPGIWENI